MPLSPNEIAIKALEKKVAALDTRIAVLNAEKAGMVALIEVMQKEGGAG